MGLPNLFPKFQEDASPDYLALAKKKTLCLCFLFSIGFSVMIAIYAVEEIKVTERVLTPTHAEYTALLSDHDPTCYCANADVEYTQIYSFSNTQDTMCDQFSSMKTMCEDSSLAGGCYPTSFYPRYYMLSDARERIGVVPGNFFEKMHKNCIATKGLFDYVVSIFMANLITSETLLKEETLMQIMGTKLNETLVTGRAAVYSTSLLGQSLDDTFPFVIASGTNHLVNENYPSENLYKQMCDHDNYSTQCASWWSTVQSKCETSFEAGTTNGFLIDFSNSNFQAGDSILWMVSMGFQHPPTATGTLDYSTYYQSCKPKYCEYSQTKKKSASELSVAAFGLYAGVLTACTVIVNSIFMVIGAERRAQRNAAVVEEAITGGKAKIAA